MAGLVLLTSSLVAQVPQPLVAIHDSELTRALEAQPATGATPNGGGTSGFQWWTTDWHYFVMPESVKEALRSDGTAFTVIGDSNITAGLLLPNGSPKYPIVISLASEAVQNSEIASLTNYVAAGGYLVVGSSAFTRNPDGSSRGNFAFANALGASMVVSGLTNWGNNSTFTKVANHRLVSHIPDGQLYWRMPSAAEEISWGISPTYVFQATHDVWQVQATDATILAEGDGSPYLMIKQYGKGFFIYVAGFQPLIGHGGFAPSTYAYAIFRQAIEWAFESAKLPVTKLSPWPYQYDAAFIVRHDLENFPNEIAHIEASAQVENSLGVKGDYYFCTGTLREGMSATYDTNAVVQSIQRAVALYGATVGPHNGGLRNPRNPSLTQPDYDYWHWGLDEALDVTPAGNVDGKSYAKASLAASFADIESWLPGLLTSSVRLWVAPRFNSTREDSYDVQSQVGVKIAGDQKLTPFPHWTLSTRTPGKRYPMLSQPVSDWFVAGLVAQSLEPWRAPSAQNTTTLHESIDYYYGLGALVNFYSHTLSTGEGDAGQLVPEYINYCLNTNAHPRMWAANAVGVYDWWTKRSTAQIAVSYATNGSTSSTTINITGASDANTSVELLLPAAGAFTAPQISLNGNPAAASSYRINGRSIKLLVGTTVTTAQVSYSLVPVAADDFYLTTQGRALTVAAPGVLANDQSGAGGGNLTAALVSGPAHGTLSLNANGAFTYTPVSNYLGADSFTYRAGNGQTSSTPATVNLNVLLPGELFADDFARLTAGSSIAPWTQVSGAWGLTNAALLGASPANSYGFAFYNDNTWTDYTVSARVRFSSINALGAGLGGRLNPVTGAHYAAWIYPEGSAGGAMLLKLIKFTGWGTWSGTPIQTVALPSVGTNAHTLALTFQGANIAVAYDGATLINVLDSGLDSVAPYLTGGITADLYTYDTPFTLSVDDLHVVAIVQAPAAKNDSYQIAQGGVLNIAAPGVLANDQGSNGTVALTAAVVTAPVHGTLNLNANGSFTYTPTNSYAGADSFVYRASGPTTNYGTATVSLYVARPGELFADDFTRTPATTAIAPWTQFAGSWAITNGVLFGASAANNYGNAYVADPTWSNYTVQARLQFSSTGGLGGGLGGRLNPTTGAHYAAWIYPEASAGGSNILKLIKFTGWANWSGTPMQSVNLANVGTNWHTLALTFQGANIAVAYDGVSLINVTDNNFDGVAPYATGGITADLYTFNTPYMLGVDDVSVIASVTASVPVITTQPLSLTNVAGTTASFAVTASGVNLGYQWRFNGASITGATASIYTLTNVQPTNAGNYSVVVSNQVGSVASSAATLTVLTPPAITTQPASRTNIVGTSASFTVVASGAGLTYQWRFNGTNIVGATTNTYTIASAQPTNAGSYSVVVANPAGSVTSSAATLTVLGAQTFVWSAPVAITTADSTLNLNGNIVGAAVFGGSDTIVALANGSSLLFKADGSVATATGPNGSALPTYGGFFSGSTTGNTNFNFVLGQGAYDNGPHSITLKGLVIGQQYTVQLFALDDRGGVIGARLCSFQDPANTNNASATFAMGDKVYVVGNFTATSTNMVILQNLPTTSNGVTNAGNINALVLRTIGGTQPPIIVTQPASRTNVLGSAASFAVTATGNALRYQWQFNGVKLANATNATFAIASVQATNAGNYAVVVSNLTTAVTSMPATLTVIVPPAITTQPASQTNVLGTAASFTVSATGSALAYQWQFNGTNIASATNTTYSLSSVQTNNAGNYTVVITNLAGKVTSAIAKLTVTVPTPPSLTVQPQSQTVTAGQNASFAVTATGSAPLSYQWRFNGTNIAGATNSAFTVVNAQVTNGGNYSVVVSNPFGAVTSSAATLGIKYSLTVTTSTGGTVSITPAASTFAPGASVTLVASPRLFYRFTGWTGDASGTATTLTVNMSGNKSIKANFVFSLF